ncbi:MAG: dihydrodipicolinate synthase family protein, partial [Candidatus Thorarchaeota archaeon]
YACSVNESIDLVNYAQKIGADAALLTTPYFFRKPSDEGMFDFFDCILKESNNFPIFLCNVPIYTLIELKHSIIENLMAKHDNIVGIKDLSSDPESITAYAGVFDNLSVLIGSDRLVFHGLNVQCDGAVSAIGCIFPKYLLQIYNTYKSGNVDQAWIEQEALTGIRSLLKRFPSRAAQKYIFSQLKGIYSYVRPPLRDLSDEDKKHLQIILEEHGLLQKKQ